MIRDRKNSRQTDSGSGKKCRVKLLFMKSINQDISDHELLNLTLLAAKTEQAATLALLDYLLEVDTRRLYAVRAYHSLFEYCVKELGYSEPAAAERVNAVRLMRKVPEVKKHLEAGALNLTTAAQIQRFVKIEEKTLSAKVSAEAQIEIITACLGQSKREFEKTLLERHCEQASLLSREKVRSLSPEHSEIKFVVSEAILKKISALKELVGEVSFESVLDQGLDLLISNEQKKQGRGERASPSRGKPAPTRPAESRYTPIEFKRVIFNRSKGQCEYVDAKTHRRCVSRYRLQIDHIQPRALGGKTEPNNLRHLCQNHNLREAIDLGLVRVQPRL